MNIEDMLNNPKFNFDLAKVLMQIRTDQLFNNYRVQAILERQIRILELQKGKTGQELDIAVESEIERLNNLFYDWLKSDYLDDINDFSVD